MENIVPKPNTQALSWFYGEFEKRSLILNPKYQRNPIWSIGQKCFLIDSIISKCPLPQVYLNIKTSGTGVKRKTVYEVVDGQQRLRAILEFMRDEYQLVSTTEKSYPVSEHYKPHINKRYSELPENLQNLIWNYPLSVQELREWDVKQIRSLFRRLNYVVEKLNKQELRHSQYFGEFVDAVEKISTDSFWDDLEVFTRRDSQRMKDVEFISELFAALIDGPQEQQKTLDTYYANYDVVFPKKNIIIRKFQTTLKSLRTIDEVIKEYRFSKKADFYALFLAVASFIKGKDSINLARSKNSLINISKELDKAPEQMSENASKYYSTVIEGGNKLPKRQLRIKILTELLKDNFDQV